MMRCCPQSGGLRQSVRLVAIRVEAKTVAAPLTSVFTSRSKSTATLSAIQQKPSNYVELKHVPKYPILGSSLSVNMDPKSMFTNFEVLRKKYGRFYTLGMPGFGVGILQTVHIVTDPYEMAKVIRKEGKRPSGAVQSQWAIKKHMKAAGYLLVGGDKTDDYGLFGRDDTWKRLRSFLQTDLLSPKAAAGYVPGAIEAARLASKGAPHFKDDLHEWLHYAAFDMFSTIMFGQITDCSNPQTPTQSTHRGFANTATEFLQLNNFMNVDGKEIVLGQSGLYETEKHKRLKFLIDDMFSQGRQFVEEFLAKDEAQLTDFERRSWLYHAKKRQADEQSVSREEMIELAIVGLSAAVDTTSSLIAWNILHLATNQEAQDKVYQELTAAIQDTGAEGLTAEILTKDRMPFFFACVREAHRVTPAAGLQMFKRCSESVEVHGQTFEEGTMFVFEGMTTVKDEELVDEPDEFVPERWLPEAVQARKGTPKEVIDHAFFKEPFSQGARRCPGSRVAMNENLALVAQLVLDWKITAPGLNSFKDATYGLRGAISPNLPQLEFTPR